MNGDGWTESKTINGEIVRSYELAPDARHRICGDVHWISITRPYDLARYHFAHSTDGTRWSIFREAARGGPEYNEYKGTAVGTPLEILVRLRMFDATVTAKIDHS